MCITASEERYRGWLSDGLLPCGINWYVVIHCSDLFDITGASLGSFKEKVKQKHKVLLLIIKTVTKTEGLPRGKLHINSYTPAYDI